MISENVLVLYINDQEEGRKNTNLSKQKWWNIFVISCKHLTKNYLHEQLLFLKFNSLQEKSQNFSGKWRQQSMIWEKISCINDCMVICIQPDNLSIIALIFECPLSKSAEMCAQAFMQKWPTILRHYYLISVKTLLILPTKSWIWPIFFSLSVEFIQNTVSPQNRRY